MSDKREKPINDFNREFARAVVSLARVMKVRSIKIVFQMEDTYQQVSATWTECRHGSKEPIHLESMAYDQIPEEES